MADSSTDTPRLIAWAVPDQETLVTDAVREGGFTLVGVGGPVRARTAELAKTLDVEAFADVRQAIQRDDVDLLWVAAPEKLDADARRLIRRLGRRVVSTEPRPVDIADLTRDPDEAATAVFVPLMRRSPGFLRVRDALDEFGPPECVNIAMGCGPGEGTLFARLFDAMDLLDHLAGPAVGVDAAVVPSEGGVPESLAALRGHLTANVRLAEGGCVCVSATDRAGSWFRRVTLVGRGGVLHVDDVGYEWTDAEGAVLEPGREPTRLTAGAIAARHMRRVLERVDAGMDPPPETARLLSLCEAARVSARTGQVVAPERLLEALRRP
jgi:predicted dehydrogenase